MKLVNAICAAACAATLAGCANLSEAVSPTPEALQNKVAGNLGFPVTDVKIGGLREGSGITYFVAETPKGTYGCSIPSGGGMAYITLGMVNLQPTCAKQ